MRRTSALLSSLGLVLLLLLPTSAAAQMADAPTFEVGALPVGVVVFTAGDSDAPGFASYALAGTFTFNFNRFVGVEGEFGGNIGVTQDLDFPDGTVSARPPHQILYSGDVVYRVGGSGRSIVPYVLGGVGGLHVFEQAEVGVDDGTNLFVLNVGGGVKFRTNRTLGFRVDYRFLAAFSADNAPEFFGGADDKRFGNRLAGGLTFSFGR